MTLLTRQYFVPQATAGRGEQPEGRTSDPPFNLYHLN